jgi:hypothetical protein|tara:strand:- start:90 stop:320 length:231 start_codon:yes stop_codon:yes gene_type:complete
MNRQVIMDALKTSKVKIDFRSLNSNRNITGIYTGHPAGQTTESNKVVVWDVVNEKWDDIEWETIISWERVNEATVG